MGYPIQLVGLEDRRVLVAGGGPVAAEKVAPLIQSGAWVHLVSPEISPQMDAWLPRVWRFDRRPVEDSDVTGARVVVAATDDPAVNRRLSRAARKEGILVNAADDPAFCDFYSPAVIRRGPVVMTISTDGGSPLLAGQLRRLLEGLIPRSLTSVADVMVRIREKGMKGLRRRGRLLRALADPSITRLVDRGETEAAADRLQEIYEEEDEPFEAGTVSIVGAGPGSRQLLTLRALDRIQRADVVLHDALVEREVLDLALPGAVLVDVGRRSGAGSSPSRPSLRGAPALMARGRSASASRSDRMIREARAGKRVVRLHGGDSFVFGRGGEEVEALEAAGIPWEAVPGVSSVMAAPAAAGVPLTQRGLAHGFTVRTGHTVLGRTRGELPVDEETVVVLMGLQSAKEVLAELAAEGRSPRTPAIAVSRASRAGERVVAGTLATLAERIRAADLESPATLIVGEVARRAIEVDVPTSAPRDPDDSGLVSDIARMAGVA